MLLLLLLLAILFSGVVSFLTGRFFAAMLIPVTGALIWALAVAEGNPSWTMGGLFILMGGYFLISSAVGAGIGAFLRRRKLDNIDMRLLAWSAAVVTLLLILSLVVSLWGDDLENKGKEFAASNAEVLSITGRVRAVSVRDRAFRGDFVSDTKVRYSSITYRITGEKGEYFVEIGMAGHPSMPKLELIQVKPLH